MNIDKYTPFDFWRDPYLFTIQKDNKRIFYNALTNDIVCVNENSKDEYSNDNIFNELTQNNVLLQKWDRKRDAAALLTIYFTKRCNLSCAYCYADHDKSVLDPETAITVFKHWYKNALRTNHSRLLINFHGSGEPLMEYDNLKKVMNIINETIKTDNIELIKMLTTNGTMLEGEKLHWVCENFNAVTISDDGPKEFSARYNKSHIEYNMKAIVSHANSYLNKNKRICKIKSIINKINLSKVVEIIRYYQDLGVNFIDFAPLLLSGKKEGKHLEIKIRDFLPEYFNSLVEAKNRSIKLISNVYSSVGGRYTYCGAFGKNLNYVLMPDGRISSCYYDTDSNEDLIFSFGFVTDRGVQYDEKKLRNLREIENSSRPQKCKNCPAVFNCGGSCMYIQKYKHNNYSSGLSNEDCKAMLQFHGSVITDMFKE